MNPGFPTDIPQPQTFSSDTQDEHPDYRYIISVYVGARRQGEQHEELIPWIASLTGVHEDLVKEMVRYAPI